MRDVLTAPAAVRAAPHALMGSLLTGLLLANVSGDPLWAVAATVAGGLLALGGRGPRVVLGLALALGGGGWIWGQGRIRATAPRVLALPAHIDAMGTVDAPAHRRTAGGWRVSVRVGDAGNAMTGARLLVWLTRRPPAVGAHVRLRGTVRAGAMPDAPTWWRRYLDRQGVSGTLWMRRMPETGRRGGLSGVRDRASAWLRGRIGAELPGDRGALVQGMALGGSGGLDPERERQVRDAGLSHLLAVSGQNVAVVAMALAVLIRGLGVARARALGGLAVGVVVYCLLCEPGASVWRAGVMAVVGLLAEAMGRDNDRWHLVLVALVALVAWQPRSVWDPGLQLSFAAVVGILALREPLMEGFRGWLPDRVAELAAVAAAAGLATAPVMVMDFGRLSLAGFVTNLVAVPVAGAVLLTGLLGAATALFAAPVSWCLLTLSGSGAALILAIARLASTTPGASVDIPPMWAPVAALPAVGVWLAHHRRLVAGAWGLRTRGSGA